MVPSTIAIKPLVTPSYISRMTGNHPTSTELSRAKH
jgi:hypothetical protein